MDEVNLRNELDNLIHEHVLLFEDTSYNFEDGKKVLVDAIITIIKRRRLELLEEVNHDN